MNHDTIRLDFKCGCWSLISSSELTLGKLLWGISCCGVHENPNQSFMGILAAGAEIATVSFFEKGSVSSFAEGQVAEELPDATN